MVNKEVLIIINTLLIEALLQLEHTYIQKMKAINAELASSPVGSLVINTRPRKTVFYRWLKGEQKGISSQSQLISQLARKRYLQFRKRTVEKEFNLIKDFLNRTTKIPNAQGLDKILQKFNKAGLNTNAITWSPLQYQSSGHQSQNPFRREDLKYTTTCGIKVRSLSEKVWGDLYELLGIPYQYEKEFIIDVTEMDGVKGAIVRNGRFYKKYYPDFTLFMNTGSFFIHEHLGRIDLEDYRNNTGERFIAFTSSHTIDTDHFLTTYPKDVEDNSRHRHILETRVLPRVST